MLRVLSLNIVFSTLLALLFLLARMVDETQVVLLVITSVLSAGGTIFADAKLKHRDSSA